MNRKNLPLVLMLVAGAITCIVNLVRNYSLLNQLTALLIVLVLFYTFGSILKWVLDLFDSQNEQNLSEEGEVIEKETEQDGQESSEKQKEQEDQT